MRDTFDQTETSDQAMGSSSVAGSPVDDHTYNVLQALTSSLEALEAYEVYQEDDEGDLFIELQQDEQRRAERLLAELRTLLNG